MTIYQGCVDFALQFCGAVDQRLEVAADFEDVDGNKFEMSGLELLKSMKSIPHARDGQQLI